MDTIPAETARTIAAEYLKQAQDAIEPQRTHLLYLAKRAMDRAERKEQT